MNKRVNTERRCEMNNYPPGVTGSEPQIVGDEEFEELCEWIYKTMAMYGITICDIKCSIADSIGDDEMNMGKVRWQDVY